MSRPRRKLDEKGEAGKVLGLLKKEPAGWRRERLHAVKLGLEGELGLEQIAEAIGRGRSRIQAWFDAYRRGGVQELLQVRRGKGPKSLLKEPMVSEMKRQLAKGQWRRAADAHQWLTGRFDLKVGLGAVYKYLGKCAARLKVPRPSHAKKNAGAAETFKSELAAKLDALGIERGRPVRIWMADEMRHGLQPVTRRVWALRGERVVVPVNPTYEWGYVYGALQVGGGRNRVLLHADGELGMQPVVPGTNQPARSGCHACGDLGRRGLSSPSRRPPGQRAPGGPARLQPGTQPGGKTLGHRQGRHLQPPLQNPGRPGSGDHQRVERILAKRRQSLLPDWSRLAAGSSKRYLSRHSTRLTV